MNPNESHYADQFDRIQDHLDQNTPAAHIQDPELAEDVRFVRWLNHMASLSNPPEPGPLFTQQVLKKVPRSKRQQVWWAPVLTLAAALLLFVFWPRQAKQDERIFIDPSLLDQIAQNETRQGLYDYLTQTEFLLVSLREPTQQCTPDQVDVQTEKEFVKGLLLQHKSFTPQMDKLEYHQVREFFQQLEIILVDLNTLNRCSDKMELDLLNQHIQEQRILTKLRLFAQEIAVS
ncbi:MAG: hypothetical protein H6510_09760 [Acidobacteria bacterium]|nr:hypothetical protein [Acidobacteriota bacterium]MCB9398092.1 hypothetical protein [Acidobacteriota bacterium]